MLDHTKSPYSPNQVFDVKEKRRLQKMQDKLCKLGKVYGCCFDEKGELLTNFSVTGEEQSALNAFVSMSQCQEVAARVHSSDMEDLLVEDTQYPWLKIAAVDVKAREKAGFIWCFVAVLSDQEGYNEEETKAFSLQTDYKHFYYYLDIMVEFSQINGNGRAIQSNIELASSISTEHEMEASVKRLGAITEVVQLLDRDDGIDMIMSDFLKIAGRFLNVSEAQIYRIHKEDDFMDLLAQYEIQEDVDRPFVQISNVPRASVWKQEGTVVISCNSQISQEIKTELDKHGIKAIAAIPITINNVVSMYACFYEKRRERSWSIEEIRFMNDAVRVLQSMITRRIQKNSLASSYASLEAVLDNVGCGIYLKDLETGQLLFVNRYVRNTFSRELKTGELDDIFGSKIRDKQTSGSYELHYIDRARWYDFYYTQLTWVNGKMARLCSIYEITDKKEYQQKIEQQAYTDFLTGLYNRMCCERDLARFVDYAKKNHTKGAILYLDLDDFKHINDGLGHQYGDVLLRAIAHSIKRITGITDTCYRMGGDEFVIVVPPENFDILDVVVQKIQDIFSKPWYLKDADYYCTMSMGVVTFPDDSDNVEDLIRKADISMYDAKKGGKNRVAKYSNSISSSSSQRLDMEKNMRDATAFGCNEFEVYYQPVIDITLPGKPCTGAEALVRWNSEDMGFVSPADFIPLAEYLGLIIPIGTYVLNQACVTCKEWNDKGHPNYKVNVNLSVVQLLQPDIVSTIRDAIEGTGINPNNLTLEVTESLAINDMRRMQEILANIRELGVRIALDDFGTGYSSLSHIREIPFDVIKVDQSFVKDLAEDNYSQAFIKMIAELAKTMGVSVCVEGIETEAQFKVLDGMNVRMIQGYYFDKPMKKKDFNKKYM